MSRRASLAPAVAPVIAIVAAVVLLASVRPAGATLIIIPNASFQNPDLADTVFTDTGSTADAVPNWTFAATSATGGIVSAGVWDPGVTDYTQAGGDNATLPGDAEGGQAAYIYLEPEITPVPLSGDLTTAAPIATVESDFSYDLTVALGRGVGIPTGDVTLALLISKFPIASVVIPASEIPENNFKDFIVNLTTFEDYPFAGAELHARITHSYAGAAAASVDIDNVRFEAVLVPEPAGASLALLALGAVVSRVRRARRAA
jgi:hypothetical protein